MLIDKYRDSINKQGVMKRYEVALEGGNVEEGRNLFFGHPQVQCSKCHAIKQIDKQAKLRRYCQAPFA